MLSPLTKQLIEALRILPGVGPKSAQRIAFQILKEQQRDKAKTIAKALDDSHAIKACQRCRHFTEETLCTICQNPSRNKELLCIVETPVDLIALEQTHSFNGYYFVLHGHLSPLDGIGPEQLGITQLLDHLNTEQPKELILATNPTVEGEATAHYITNHVKHLDLRCSRIAHGVPMGGELEYLDGNTLNHALSSRILIEE